MMFPLMHSMIPEGQIGHAQVVHDTPSKLEVIRSAFHGVTTEERVHTRLLVSGRVMMTDARFEQTTNVDAVLQSRGDVLIAGLGIGMILVPILKKNDVQSVTVVEKSPDVIALVGPRHACPKLTIVQGDVWEWLPTKEARYDAIYFDIWPDLCTDNLAEMTKLHRRFRKHLRAEGWMGSWCRDYLRAQKRRGY